MTTTTTQREKCIDVCNGLLRGERSAVETYNKAIEKFPDEKSMGDLRKIRDDHQRAVDLLTANVQKMKGEPDNKSGAWGTWANLVQTAANFFGENSAISALLQGERYGVSFYQTALADEDVMPVCKALIRDQLLTRTLFHVTTLDNLQGYPRV